MNFYDMSIDLEVTQLCYFFRNLAGFIYFTLCQDQRNQHKMQRKQNTRESYYLANISGVISVNIREHQLRVKSD